MRSAIFALVLLAAGFAAGLLAGRRGGAPPSGAGRVEPARREAAPPPVTVTAETRADPAVRVVMEAALEAQALALEGAARANGRIVGRVRTRRGEGVAGVTVTAGWWSEEGAPAVPPASLEAALREAAGALVTEALLRRERAAVTDADGAYAIEGVPEGPWEVEVPERPDLETLAHRERSDGDRDPRDVVRMGGTAALERRVDFLATPLRRVRVRIVGPAGEAPVEANVEVADPGRDFGWRRASEFSLGTPELRLPEGVYVVGGSATFPAPPGETPHESALAPEPLVVPAGIEARPLALTLAAPAPSLLAGTVATDDPEGEEWDHVRVGARPVAVPDPDDPRGALLEPREVHDRLLGHHENDERPYDIEEEVRFGRFEFTALLPGTYDLAARRVVEPPEPEGPAVRIVVPPPGEPVPAACVALPPRERLARIAVALAGAGDERFDIVIERRLDGGTVTPVAERGHHVGSATDDVFRVRRAAWRDPEGRPATLFVRLAYLVAPVEATVPEGDDVRVVLHMPATATLTARIERGAYPDGETSLIAILRRGVHPGEAPGPDAEVRVSRDVIPPSGVLRLQAHAGVYEVVIAAAPGSVPEGTTVAQVEGDDAIEPSSGRSALSVLASRVVTLAPGENEVAIALPPRAGAAIVPDRAGRLVVFPASGRGERLSASVEPGVRCALPLLAPGEYVAVLFGKPDPLASESAPSSRAAMAFTTPRDGPAIAFAPTSVEGWASLVVQGYSRGEGIHEGDVILEVEGDPVRDPWAPFAAALALPVRSPDEARVTVLRDGERLEVRADLAWIRKWSPRTGAAYAPIPR